MTNEEMQKYKEILKERIEYVNEHSFLDNPDPLIAISQGINTLMLLETKMKIEENYKSLIKSAEGIL